MIDTPNGIPSYLKLTAKIIMVGRRNNQANKQTNKQSIQVDKQKKNFWRRLLYFKSWRKRKQMISYGTNVIKQVFLYLQTNFYGQNFIFYILFFRSPLYELKVQSSLSGRRSFLRKYGHFSVITVISPWSRSFHCNQSFIILTHVLQSYDR